MAIPGYFLEINPWLKDTKWRVPLLKTFLKLTGLSVQSGHTVANSWERWSFFLKLLLSVNERRRNLSTVSFRSVLSKRPTSDLLFEIWGLYHYTSSHPCGRLSKIPNSQIYWNLLNFPIDSLVFYVWDQNLDFFEKTVQFWVNILHVPEFFLANSVQKTFLYVHEKLQRNPWQMR